MNSRFRPPSVASKHAAEHDAAMDRLVAAVSAARRTAASERDDSRLPSASWTELLRRCTPREVAALDRYRHIRGETRGKYRRGELTRAAAAHRYTTALETLAQAEAGSPTFDRFVAGEQHYLRIWKDLT